MSPRRTVDASARNATLGPSIHLALHASKTPVVDGVMRDQIALREDRVAQRITTTARRLIGPTVTVKYTFTVE